MAEGMGEEQKSGQHRQYHCQYHRATKSAGSAGVSSRFHGHASSCRHSHRLLDCRLWPRPEPRGRPAAAGPG